MTFADFYRVDQNGRALPTCGSDSVAILDGRLRPYNLARRARIICENRGYAGFAICAGRSFSDSRVIRALEMLQKEKA